MERRKRGNAGRQFGLNCLPALFRRMTVPKNRLESCPEIPPETAGRCRGLRALFVGAFCPLMIAQKTPKVKWGTGRCWKISEAVPSAGARGLAEENRRWQGKKRERGKHSKLFCEANGDSAAEGSFSPAPERDRKSRAAGKGAAQSAAGPPEEGGPPCQGHQAIWSLTSPADWR